MKSTSGKENGLFFLKEIELIMCGVALGVNWLHSCGIVHRNLKASNVFVQKSKSNWLKWICHVANHECSIGIVGMGFFRGSKLLQACKDGMISKKLEVFSRTIDAYSFGMICYEILTWKLYYF